MQRGGDSVGAFLSRAWIRFLGIEERGEALPECGRLVRMPRAPTCGPGVRTPASPAGLQRTRDPDPNPTPFPPRKDAPRLLSNCTVNISTPTRLRSTMSTQPEYRYNRLTWPEMNEAIAAQKLVILPTASTEQHGRHLPLDVDTFLCESVCLEVGKRAPDKVLVLPTIAYGLNLHHIDFPGTIHIEPDAFINFCLNITKSVAYHGFQKILIVNGHGSNTPLIDLIARKTVLETKSLCFAAGYGSFLLAEFEKIKESKVMAHADEFETSLYLHLAPDRV